MVPLQLGGLQQLLPPRHAHPQLEMKLGRISYRWDATNLSCAGTTIRAANVFCAQVLQLLLSLEHPNSALWAAYLPASGQSVGLQTSRILQKLEMCHTFGTFTRVSGGCISCRSACIMSLFTFGSSFLSLASFGEQRLAYTGATLGSTLQLSLLGC